MSRRPSFSFRVLAAASMATVALMLTACGGGGDDDGSTAHSTRPVAQPVPGEQAVTNRELDLAIEGDGYFVYEDGHGRTVYSRVASLQRDRDGAFVNALGWRLQGSAAAMPASVYGGQALRKAKADADTSVTPLPAAPSVMHTEATTTVSLEANLDSRESVPSGWTMFDAEVPMSYNQARTFDVYDTLGTKVPLTLYFSKSGDNAWEVRAQIAGESVMFGSGNDMEPLLFNPDGSLGSPVDPLTLSTTAMTSGGYFSADLVLDLTALIQQPMNFAMTKVDVDGHAPGLLTQLTVTPDGWVAASYDNGLDLMLGRVRLAQFAAGDWFTPVGDGGWACETRCSPPAYVAPGVQLTGLIATGTLESAASK